MNIGCEPGNFVGIGFCWQLPVIATTTTVDEHVYSIRKEEIGNKKNCLTRDDSDGHGTFIYQAH